MAPGIACRRAACNAGSCGPPVSHGRARHRARWQELRRKRTDGARLLDLVHQDLHGILRADSRVVVPLHSCRLGRRICSRTASRAVVVSMGPHCVFMGREGHPFPLMAAGVVLPGQRTLEACAAVTLTGGRSATGRLLRQRRWQTQLDSPRAASAAADAENGCADSTLWLMRHMFCASRRRRSARRGVC